MVLFFFAQVWLSEGDKLSSAGYKNGLMTTKCQKLFFAGLLLVRKFFVIQREAFCTQYYQPK